jgi:ribose transport system substrate-binding protein
MNFRRRKRGAILLALVVLAAVLAACGGSSSSSGGGASSGEVDKAAAAAAAVPKAAGVVAFTPVAAGSGAGLKLGYISLGESVPFVKLVTTGIQQAAKTAGATMIVCDSELDGQKALQCAKSFATQGVKAYLNFQVDQKLSPAICTAGPKVPVIAIDITQAPCQVSFLGAANAYAGQIAGAALGEFAKDKWNCDYDAYISLESTASVDANRLRMGGNRTGFTKYCPIKNQRILDADRTDPARTKFTDTLTALPGKHRILVVAINDDGLVGATAAAKTSNRLKDVYFSGQGADPTSWCGIKTNPNWIGDAAYFPDRYGQVGVPALINAAKGGKIPANLLIPHVYITRNNIDKYFKVPACG